MRRVPSLRGLQAFEAVARTGSLAAAASSIGITPSAVSHRIRGLEDELGLPLLRRLPKGLGLTEAGRRYLGPVEHAFALLAEATADLLGPDVSRPLTVSLTSEFGVRWLMPRFHRFRALHPDIDIALLTTYQLANLLDGEADLALRYGAGKWPGLRAEPLLRFAVSPLCAPSVMAEIGGLPPAEALARVTLIRALEDDWDSWLTAAGMAGFRPARELRFVDYSMALSAALGGQGMVLGYSGYVETEVAAGRLVQPFALSIPVHNEYYLVYVEQRLADPRVRAFRDWVISEAEPARDDPS
jgi:LysR family transcriptional regulator, glycine cleavage system transcriptional activator